METYKLDADERRLHAAERVRATLAPRPERQHYPAPWRVAEERDGRMVVDANGDQACHATSHAAAEAIVLAVNTFAGVSEA